MIIKAGQIEILQNFDHLTRFQVCSIFLELATIGGCFRDIFFEKFFWVQDC